MKKRPSSTAPSPRVPATLIRFMTVEAGVSVRLAKTLFLALGEGGQVITNAEILTSNLDFSKFVTVTLGGRFNVYKGATDSAGFKQWIAKELAKLAA